MITIIGEKRETKYQVQKINIHSDFAPFREWMTVAGNLDRKDADLYHQRMKNSDNCVWRVIPDHERNN